MKWIKSLVDAIDWGLFNLAISLFPIGLGIIFIYLRGTKVTVNELLAGTDLYFAGFIMLASTLRDLVFLGTDMNSFPSYKLVFTFMLLSTMLSVVIFASVFTVQFEKLYQGSDFDKEFVANGAIAAMIIVSVMCLPIQILIFKRNRK